MPESGAKRYWPPISLLPEFLAALWRRAWRPLRVAWRRTWVYRRFLKGKMPDRILFYPYDALPRRLEDADALLRGRFRLAGDVVEVTEGSIFDKPAVTSAWVESLQSFSWLPPLAAAGGDPARRLATNLMTQWVKRYTHYSEPAWLPHIIARRLVHLFAHGRFVLMNSEVLWRSKIFVSLREQSRQLARTVDEAPDGVPRFEAAAALALSGACLDDSTKRLESGLARLESQIVRQVLPDGGHVSRSPEALLHAYRHVVMVIDALTAIDHPVPTPIRSAHDRMAPMVRFFRHGDGALALFNGGRECDPRSIAGLLARDDVRGQPFVYAPHSGFQRLVAGRSLALLDCGIVPKGAFANEAHAGCLSFEFSAGQQRIVVNCGAASRGQVKWEDALRATAAHSTVSVADTSMAHILGAGLARDLLGARLLGGSTSAQSSRHESAAGWSVDARHDGYVRAFGLEHARELTLSPHGDRLAGRDRLSRRDPAQKTQHSFAVRFHIHPDVRCSLSQGGDVLLKLPSGEGWRFQASGGDIALEDSVYLGSDVIRRTEQLVVTGWVGDRPAEVQWVFEQIGS